jgi:1L-myo-inositol 1-phosphate cytidylyltransferase
MTQESTTSTGDVQDAVVLAAGNGDRFRHQSPRSKLLTSIAGTPLLIRTLNAAQQAGITTVHLVVGYDAEHVVELASTASPPGLRVHAHLNRDWRLENGVSVLAARPCLHDRPFALLMGDHLFDDRALQRLRSAPRQPGETLLCVDRRAVPLEVAEEATRVRMSGGRITAIGKDLEPYDALDTGLFICDPSVFGALEESCRSGDTTLSGGIRHLTAAGAVRGVDIGDARWCDVDTLEDVPQAEQVAAPMCPA